MIYEPREDSLLLQKHVKKYAKGSVLDMGTGSAIQAVEAAKKKSVSGVLAVDIQDDVIETCLKTVSNKKIKFIQSNLFSSITETFDTIIFNPPYLPEHPKLKDITLDGGKKGYETIKQFLKAAPWHLREKGVILLVFSSLTNKNRVDSLIKANNLKKKLLEKVHIFFEDLYCYKIYLL